MEKIFAVYKPKGPTSHDMVNLIRKATGERRIGHAGTLDPLASGILVIGVGREATKKLKDAVAAEKEYIAKVRLGAESTTDDEEGKKKSFEVAEIPPKEEVNSILKNFTGTISQIAPQYSAIKARGKPLYFFARKGIRPPPQKVREVFIKEIEIIDYAWPFLELRVVTGPGVYIRSLARDLGCALKTGGYLAELERIRVGRFRKEDALSLEMIGK